MVKITKVLAVTVVLISFGFFIKSTDLSLIIPSIQKIGYRVIYLLLITFAAYWSATRGWKYCMGTRAAGISSAYLFVVRHIGEMVSLVSPASVVGGEAVKIYLLQNTGLDKPTIISSVLVARVMMIFTQLLLFFLTLIYVFFNNNDFFYRLPQISWYVIAAVFLIIALITVCWRIDFLTAKIKRHNFLPKLEQLAVKFKLRQIQTEFLIFFNTNKKGLVYCTLFFGLHWVVGSLEIYFILKFIGIKAGIIQVLFVDMGIVIFKSAATFIPGQIGIEELANKIMLEMIGISDARVWITVSVLRRTRQVFWIVCGLIFYLFYNFKHKRLSEFINGDPVRKS